jgi:hypothetical protein
MGVNLKNIQAAIDIMERNEKAHHNLNMDDWIEGELVKHESELTCSTACCFAGFIALSPEFQSVGGRFGVYK